MCGLDTVFDSTVAPIHSLSAATACSASQGEQTEGTDRGQQLDRPVAPLFHHGGRTCHAIRPARGAALLKQRIHRVLAGARARPHNAGARRLGCGAFGNDPP